MAPIPRTAASPVGSAWVVPAALDGRSGWRRPLVVLRGEIENENLWLVDREARAEWQLTDFSQKSVIGDFDVSGDDQDIVFSRVPENSNLVLIDRVRH